MCKMCFFYSIMIIKASFNTFLSEVITRVIVDADKMSFILTSRLYVCV